ncbi:mCG146148, partial [Mus musculus]
SGKPASEETSGGAPGLDPRADLPQRPSRGQVPRPRCSFRSQSHLLHTTDVWHFWTGLSPMLSLKLPLEITKMLLHTELISGEKDFDNLYGFKFC